MSRSIKTHTHNVANEHICIEVLDQPGPGNANHHYFLSGFHTKGNPSADSSCNDNTGLHVLFQNGPIRESGINGVTNEALLALVIDRLQGFQSGPYACRENALALTKLEESMHWMLHRTILREVRGVEGTSTV